MKKLCCFLLAAALLLTLLPRPVVHAEDSEYVNDGTYRYVIVNGAATLLGVVENVKLTGKITLPTSVNGVPVTTLGERALRDHPGITELVIPSPYITLENYCMLDLTGLKRVYIAETVKKFGDSMIFDRCENVEFVYLAGKRDKFKLTILPTTTKVYVDYDIEGPHEFTTYATIYPLSELHFDPLTANEQSENGFSYVIADGKATVTAAPQELNVTIPDTLGGAPVCYLMPRLFQEASIRRITLPSTVEELPYSCFSRSEIQNADLTHIKKIGVECFSYTDDLWQITIPSSCKEICASAFNDSNLRRIELPEGVEYVGDSAFANNHECKHISLPSTLTHLGKSAFYLSLTDELIIPPSLTEIPYRAFYWSLRISPDPDAPGCKLTLPDTLTEIGDGAFNSCIISEIMLPQSLKHIGASAFSDGYFYCDLTIPGSVETLGDKAFYYTKMKNVTLLPGVKHLGAEALLGNYESLTLPEGIETIGESALAGWYNSDTLTVPAGVLECEDAFKNCHLKIIYGWDPAVESAALLAGTRYIDLNTGKESPAPHDTVVDGVVYQVLSSCAILTDGKNAVGKLTIPETVEGKPVVRINANAFEQNNALTELTIPDSVTNVGAYAFRSCQALKTTVLGNGIKTIPAACFRDCRQLQSVELPSGLEEIGAHAFGFCEALAELNLPEGLRVIGEGAFIYCNALKFVILPDSLERIGYDAFSSCESLRLLLLPDDFAYEQLYAFPGEDDTLNSFTSACYVYTAGTKAEEYVQKINAYSFAVPQDGEYYMTQNAVYRKDGEEMTLIFCPVEQGGLFVLNDTVAGLPVTRIGESAFEPQNIVIDATQIYLGSYVRSLEKHAFANLKGMIPIWFPDCTEQIDPEAFDGAESLILLGKLGGAIQQIAEEKKYNGFEFYDNRYHPFEDLALTWYYDPVLWAYHHDPQITNGVTETEFCPGMSCTRGQVVTFLWRAMGKPTAEDVNNPFTDVKMGDFYYQAVLWAVDSGITMGVTETTFAPKEECTRAQVVTFLWRAMGKPEPQNTDVPFVDVRSGFYYNAMLWAVENGITNGTSQTRFSPDSFCTRAQVVTFLYRCDASNG